MATIGEVLDAMAAWPVRDLDDILAPGPLLVLAPHPDDESIGCGGLIATAAARGREVHVAVLTDGTGSHPQSASTPAARLRQLREGEARRAVSALGVAPERLAFLGQPDGHAPHDGPDFEAVVVALRETVSRHRVATILTTWRQDPHPDHKSAAKLAEAVAQAAGITPLEFPVWGLTLPREASYSAKPPVGSRLDIAGFLPAKRRAIAAHLSQTTHLIRDSPYGSPLPASFLALFDRPWEAIIAS